MRASVLSILAAIFMGGPAAASTLAVESVESSGGMFFCFGGTNCGFAFTADRNLTVKAIGAYDEDADGLGDTVVTLYDFDTQEVLAAATATSSSRLAGFNLIGPVVGDYRMVDLLTSVPLLAGERYMIAALDGTGPSLNGATFTANGISDLQGYRADFSTGFPTTVHPDVLLSANFEYETAVIPIPASFPLLGAALVGLIGLRRRA